MRPLELSESILVRAGKTKSGDLIYESRPGAHINADRGLLLPSNDSHVVHVNASTGDDSTGDGSSGNPYKTISKADTEISGSGGSLTHIEWQTDDLLSDEITNPTQASIGVTPTIKVGADWIQRTVPSTDNLRMLDFANSLFIVSGGDSGAGKFYKSTSGLSWTSHAHAFATGVAMRGITHSGSLYVGVGHTDTGANPRIQTSPDFNTWTSRTSAASAGSGLLDVAYGNSIFVNVGFGGAIESSPDGTIWTSQKSSGNELAAIVYANNIFCAVGGFGDVFTSSNGTSWTSRTGTTMHNRGLVYGNGLFVSVGYYLSSAKLQTSPNGIIWTERTIPSPSSKIINAVVYANNMFYAYHNQSGYYESIDGITWTEYSISSSFRYAANGNNIIMGHVSVTTNVYTMSDSIEINADLCGFVLVAQNINITTSNIKLLNCTGNDTKLNIDSQINIDACKIINSDDNALDITANIFEIINSLIKALASGKFAIQAATVPSGTADVKINQNTIIGDINLDNTGATADGTQMRDNIIEGSITADEATNKFTMESGNIRGTTTNVLATKNNSSTDPLFQDAVDYKIQRIIDNFDFDSPLVGVSFFGVRDDGEARDMGAWNIDDSDLTDIFQRAMYIPKPSGQNAMQLVKSNRANLQVGSTGEPTVFNDPDRQLDIINIQYGSITKEILDFFDYIESLRDTTCFVAIDPETLVDVANLVVDGNQNAGVITIDINTETIVSGSRLTISGKKYYLVNAIPDHTSATTIVLDRVLEDNILDNDVITVQSPVGTGNYLYVPQRDRRITRIHANEVHFVTGLQIQFVRKFI